jgi:cupin fold WbuC family metalloprotein
MNSTKREQIHVVGQREIGRMAREAAHSPRKRVHLLLHDGPQDQVQRLLIVLQPGSYVRPHHHSQQWEMLVLQQGRGMLLNFSADGHLLAREEMSAASPIAQIPIGVWHGFIVLDAATAVMEIKPGPYRPNEFAHWAPAEADARAPAFIGWASSAALGTRWDAAGW